MASKMKIHRYIKEAKMKKISLIVVAVFFVTSVVSCMAIGTGGKQIDEKATLGQELIDLQKAKDEGAISDQEYKELREKLKESYE
jgi:hypothetical protein